MTDETTAPVFYSAKEIAALDEIKKALKEVVESFWAKAPAAVRQAGKANFEAFFYHDFMNALGLKQGIDDKETIPGVACLALSTALGWSTEQAAREIFTSLVPVIEKLNEEIRHYAKNKH